MNVINFHEKFETPWRKLLQYIFKKYSDLRREYNQFDTFQLKKLLERQKNWLLMIDFLNLLSNDPVLGHK